MNDQLLTLSLRLTGVGLLALAAMHLPIGKKLGWNEDVKHLTPENEAVFHSHVFFICFGLSLLGVALSAVPSAFIERSLLGRIVSVMLLVFWLARLIRQWFAFPWVLWQGKRFETMAHLTFTVVWLALVTVFGWLTWHQFQG